MTSAQLQHRIGTKLIHQTHQKKLKSDRSRNRALTVGKENTQPAITSPFLGQNESPQASDVIDVSDTSLNVSSKSKPTSPVKEAVGSIYKANGKKSTFYKCALLERGGASS